MDSLLTRCFLCGAQSELLPHLTARICRACFALLSSRGGGPLGPEHHVPADRIVDHLFLGPERAAVSAEYLAAEGIGRVLVISDTSRAYFRDDPRVEYLIIELDDAPGESLLDVLPRAMAFMQPAPPRPGSFGPNCLVHCVSGMSRSAALIIAYVMRTQGRGYEEALALVRARRPVVCPNPGFARQLRSLEPIQTAQRRND